MNLIKATLNGFIIELRKLGSVENAVALKMIA